MARSGSKPTRRLMTWLIPNAPTLRSAEIAQRSHISNEFSDEVRIALGFSSNRRRYSRSIHRC